MAERLGKVRRFRWFWGGRWLLGGFVGKVSKKRRDLPQGNGFLVRRETISLGKVRGKKVDLPRDRRNKWDLPRGNDGGEWWEAELLGKVLRFRWLLGGFMGKVSKKRWDLPQGNGFLVRRETISLGKVRGKKVDLPRRWRNCVGTFPGVREGR